MVADTFGNPLSYVQPEVASWSVYGVNLVNTRANLLQAGNVLDAAAIDKYSFLRNAYLQRRAMLSGYNGGGSAGGSQSLPDYGQEALPKYDTDDGAAAPAAASGAAAAAAPSDLASGAAAASGVAAGAATTVSGTAAGAANAASGAAAGAATAASGTAAAGEQAASGTAAAAAPASGASMPDQATVPAQQFVPTPNGVHIPEIRLPGF
jgi:phospholipid-binding lipoprotein MlaA